MKKCMHKGKSRGQGKRILSSPTAAGWRHAFRSAPAPSSRTRWHPSPAQLSALCSARPRAARWLYTPRCTHAAALRTVPEGSSAPSGALRLQECPWASPTPGAGSEGPSQRLQDAAPPPRPFKSPHGARTRVRGDTSR